MNRDQIFESILAKKSYLCIGLDTDLKKIPAHLLAEPDPIFAFNKAIIEATHDLCVAYKPNMAFYEAQGVRGWQALEKTIAFLNALETPVFTIADAKRGDIGNTSALYAEAFFENLNFDAVTVAPYMGADSVVPFLGFPEKWVILLGLTSNSGAQDFQLPNAFYRTVIEKAQNWANPDALMFVIGATRPAFFREIRALAPEYFFLVPGVGAQGGDLQSISAHGMNAHCGLIVNSSREILYASDGLDFAQKAREKALVLQQQMALILKEKFSI
jgi:orotidine-5'-phosphate decarboxylase